MGIRDRLKNAYRRIDEKVGGILPGGAPTKAPPSREVKEIEGQKGIAPTPVEPATKAPSTTLPQSKAPSAPNRPGGGGKGGEVIRDGQGYSVEAVQPGDIVIKPLPPVYPRPRPKPTIPTPEPLPTTPEPLPVEPTPTIITPKPRPKPTIPTPETTPNFAVYYPGTKDTAAGTYTSEGSFYPQIGESKYIPKGYEEVYGMSTKGGIQFVSPKPKKPDKVEKNIYEVVTVDNANIQGLVERPLTGVETRGTGVYNPITGGFETGTRKLGQPVEPSSFLDFLRQDIKPLKKIDEALLTPQTYVIQAGATTRRVKATKEELQKLEAVGEKPTIIEYKPGFVQYAAAGLVPSTVGETALFLGTAGVAGVAMKTAPVITSALFTGFGAYNVPKYVTAETPEEKSSAAAGTLGLLGVGYLGGRLTKPYTKFASIGDYEYAGAGKVIPRKDGLYKIEFIGTETSPPRAIIKSSKLRDYFGLSPSEVDIIPSKTVKIVVEGLTNEKGLARGDVQIKRFKTGESRYLVETIAKSEEIPSLYVVEGQPTQRQLTSKLLFEFGKKRPVEGSDTKFFEFRSKTIPSARTEIDNLRIKRISEKPTFEIFNPASVKKLPKTVGYVEVTKAGEVNYGTASIAPESKKDLYTVFSAGVQRGGKKQATVSVGSFLVEVGKPLQSSSKLQAELLPPKIKPVDVITVYHGTTAESAARIRSEGFKLMQTQGIGKNKDVIYLTTNKELAEGFGRRAVTKSIVKGKPTTPEIISVEIPKTELIESAPNQKSIIQEITMKPEKVNEFLGIGKQKSPELIALEEAQRKTLAAAVPSLIPMKSAPRSITLQREPIAFIEKLPVVPRTESIIKTPQVENIIQVDKQKVSQIELIGTVTKEGQKQEIVFKPITKNIIDFDSISKTDTKQDQLQEQISQQLQEQTQAQQQVQRQKQIQRQTTRMIGKSIITTGLFKPRIGLPKRSKQKSNLLSKVRQAFKVVTFRGGKEVTIASGLPEGLAKKAGVREVLTSLRASFKLKPSGTTTQEDISFKLPTGFRMSKVEKGRYVQEKTLRFGARTETKEAQFFRKQKTGRVKWF